MMFLLICGRRYHAAAVPALGTHEQHVWNYNDKQTITYTSCSRSAADFGTSYGQILERETVAHFSKLMLGFRSSKTKLLAL